MSPPLIAVPSGGTRCMMATIGDLLRGKHANFIQSGHYCDISLHRRL